MGYMSEFDEQMGKASHRPARLKGFMIKFTGHVSKTRWTELSAALGIWMDDLVS